jgi:hypothetical protein
MREVLVPTGFTAPPCRRPIVVIAAWLVVLQAFLAGVVIAQAGALLALAPIDAAAICHGAGGGTVDGSAPDAEKIRHLCCTACLSAAPANAPPPAPAVSALEPGRDARPPAFTPLIIVMSPGVVRAGSSQAPPASA